MNKYFISLTRGLNGLYIVAIAKDEETVREYANLYLKEIWGNVYTEAYFYELIRRRYPHSKVINQNRPLDLQNGPRYD